MADMHDKRFPGENADYRTARNDLLTAEMDLRRQVEAVAAMRRGLPPGGPLKEDYLFKEGATDLADRETVKETRLSDLFAAGKDTLAIYGFMYGPDTSSPCPMCTAFLDSLNVVAAHAIQQINLAVVAKAPIRDIRTFAASRGWTNLRLLSSGGTTYNADYFTETPDGEQIPVINVFRKTADGIRHAYGSELFFVPEEPGQNPRHMDMMFPLWNLLDITPDGRGATWFPQLSYD